MSRMCLVQGMRRSAFGKGRHSKSSVKWSTERDAAYIGVAINNAGQLIVHADFNKLDEMKVAQ